MVGTVVAVEENDAILKELLVGGGDGVWEVQRHVIGNAKEAFRGGEFSVRETVQTEWTVTIFFNIKWSYPQ